MIFTATGRTERKNRRLRHSPRQARLADAMGRRTIFLLLFVFTRIHHEHVHSDWPTRAAVAHQCTAREKHRLGRI